MKKAINKIIRNAMSHGMAGGGLLSFFEYMNLALYAKGEGYYSSSFPKIGSQGDFITAPELTPLFAKAIALQFAEIFSEVSKNILEFGAGTGKFAIDVLRALEDLGVEIEHYFILELSEGLRAKQQEYCSKFAGLSEKISWLSALPEAGSFSGIIFANEVLDAMPVHRFIKKNGEILEQSVKFKSEQVLEYGEPLPPSKALLDQVLGLESRLGAFPEGYCSEMNLFSKPWLAAINQSLNQGAVLLIDYGYSEIEYYSPSRSSGTLACYSRHQVNSDPLLNPGEQDITAHVDFTQIAEAAISLGFDLEGYTTQGLFLANLMIGQEDVDPVSSQHLRRLMHPEAMGEMFKVLGLSKNISANLDSDLIWKGFKGVDQRHRL